MDEMDGFLSAVDEFVDDEERIVTYKWLSKQLAVSVGQSREILQRYIDSRKTQKNGIHVVYAIIGRGPSGMCVKVVKDNDLEVARSKIDHVISTSIYSVQKMDLLESRMLYAADYCGVQRSSNEDAKLGGITYNGAVKLTKDDIKKRKRAPEASKESMLALEKQFAKPANDKNKSVQQKMNFFGKSGISHPKIKSETEKQSVEKSQPVKEEIVPPVSKKTQKKAGMSAFMTKDKSDPFAKTKSAIKVKEEPVQPKNDRKTSPKDDTSPAISPEKGIEHDVEPKKAAENGVNRSPQNSSSTKRKFEEEDLKIDDFSDIDDDDFKTEKHEKTPEKLSEKTKISQSKKTEKSKKTTKKKSELPAKKRKRILAISSSSEDESEGEDFQEEIDMIPPSPPPPQPVSVSPDLGNHQEGTHKRMKKVLKTRTFIDEDGFMVTEKSYELEGCDDPEPVSNGNGDKTNLKTSEPEPKKKKFPEKSTAAQPKKPTKQASIMGFFKKK